MVEETKVESVVVESPECNDYVVYHFTGKEELTKTTIPNVNYIENEDSFFKAFNINGKILFMTHKANIVSASTPSTESVIVKEEPKDK